MAARRFRQVDVFTATPLAGNPVAVVLDADGIDEATMRRLAAWTNLSETTFVLPARAPEASYRLRIFTPRGEIRFAGHPTIGSAHAALEAGLVTPRDGVLRQECAAGVLPIRIADGHLSVRVPPARLREPSLDRDALAQALGAPPAGTPRAVDVGPSWLVVPLADEATVRRLTPDLVAVERIARAADVGGITVFALCEGAIAVVVRSFAPGAGVPEDPVCGSGNAAVGACLGSGGLIARTGERYRASQGRELGREGVVDVVVADECRTIDIGGHAVTVIAGTLTL